VTDPHPTQTIPQRPGIKVISVLVIQAPTDAGFSAILQEQGRKDDIIGFPCVFGGVVGADVVVRAFPFQFVLEEDDIADAIAVVALVDGGAGAEVSGVFQAGGRRRTKVKSGAEFDTAGGVVYEVFFPVAGTVVNAQARGDVARVAGVVKVISPGVGVFVAITVDGVVAAGVALSDEGLGGRRVIFSWPISAPA
jgi:hypothetical protein